MHNQPTEHHSFTFLRPEVTVVTRIAHDHPENYRDLEAHIAAYTTFATGLRPGGVLVANVDDPSTAGLATAMQRLRPDVSVVTVGEVDSATVRIDSIERRDWSIRVTVVLPGNVPVVLRLHTPAIHHARNAVAALAALVTVGEDPVDAAEAISSFIGVRRRFTPIGENGGVTVVDCYAGHHNEITADLQAARAVAGQARVNAVCQPSGYRRVSEFGRQIGMALAGGSDVSVLLPIHGATPEPGYRRRSSVTPWWRQAVRCGSVLCHRGLSVCR